MECGNAIACLGCVMTRSGILAETPARLSPQESQQESKSHYEFAGH
jgi:hypothetical protein